jgi:hypothetical protein
MPKKGGGMYVDSIGIKSKNINDLILKVKKGLPTSSFEKLRKKLDGFKGAKYRGRERV